MDIGSDTVLYGATGAVFAIFVATFIVAYSDNRFVQHRGTSELSRGKSLFLVYGLGGLTALSWQDGGLWWALSFLAAGVVVGALLGAGVGAPSTAAATERNRAHPADRSHGLSGRRLSRAPGAAFAARAPKLISAICTSKSTPAIAKAI